MFFSPDLVKVLNAYDAWFGTRTPPTYTKFLIWYAKLPADWKYALSIAYENKHLNIGGFTHSTLLENLTLYYGDNPRKEDEVDEIHWDYVRDGGMRLLEMWTGDVEASGFAYLNPIPTTFLEAALDLIPAELVNFGAFAFTACVSALLFDDPNSYFFLVKGDRAYVSRNVKVPISARNHYIFDGKPEINVSGIIILHGDCTFHSVVPTNNLAATLMPENAIGVMFCGLGIRGRMTVGSSKVNAELKRCLPDSKIEAIKAFRAFTGFGLKESKDVIDRVLYQQLKCRYSRYYKGE